MREGTGAKRAEIHRLGIDRARGMMREGTDARRAETRRLGIRETGTDRGRRDGTDHRTGVAGFRILRVTAGGIGRGPARGIGRGAYRVTSEKAESLTSCCIVRIVILTTLLIHLLTWIRRRRHSRSGSESDDLGGYVPRIRRPSKHGITQPSSAPGASDAALNLVDPAERQRQAQQWILQQQAGSLARVQEASTVALGGPRKNREIFVGNIDAVVTKQALTALFDDALAVAFPNATSGDAKPVVNIQLGDQATYGFVELLSEELATAAIAGLNGLVFCGRPLTIARPTGWVDPAAAATITARAAAERGEEHSTIVCLSNIVTESDLADEEAYAELLADVRTECAKCGEVKDIRIPRGGPVGSVFVKMGDESGANKVQTEMAGRRFDGRAVVVSRVSSSAFDSI